MARSNDLIPEALTVTDVALIERIAVAIGAIDNTVSRGFSSDMWQRRAMWLGYARAARLQGFETDEIDVISWATSVSLPGRARPNSLTDPFDGFPSWERALAVRNQRHWREDLPFTVRIEPNFAGAPLLLRALAITAQYATADPSIAPWLHLPLLIHRLGLSSTPLPCLVAGDKALRFGRGDAPALLRRLLRDLVDQAEAALAVLRDVESERRQWIQTLGVQRKPGALTELAALSMRAPVLRPEQIGRTLALTPSGAGKLLDRAARLGLLQEVSGRRSWRVYMVPSLARRLGFAPALRGRPRKPPPLPGTGDTLGAILAAFDAEMAAISARFPAIATVVDDADEEMNSGDDDRIVNG